MAGGGRLDGTRALLGRRPRRICYVVKRRLQTLNRTVWRFKPESPRNLTTMWAWFSVGRSGSTERSHSGHSTV